MDEKRPIEPRFQVELTIDGRPMPLKPFLHDMIGGAVEGLCSGLKDVDHPQTIEVRVVRQNADGR